MAIPPLRELVGRWEEHMKGMLMPSTLFEELGFNYIGPIDGHDFEVLIPTLRNMRAMRGPCLLHVVTRKGRGYRPAEGQPVTYHGVTPFDLATGKLDKSAGKPTYTQIFGRWLCDAAEQDPRLVVADVRARYFGIELNDRSLTPDADAHIGATRLDDWLGRAAA